MYFMIKLDDSRDTKLNSKVPAERVTVAFSFACCVFYISLYVLHYVFFNILGKPEFITLRCSERTKHFLLFTAGYIAFIVICMHEYNLWVKYSVRCYIRLFSVYALAVRIALHCLAKIVLLLNILYSIIAYKQLTIPD